VGAVAIAAIVQFVRSGEPEPVAQPTTTTATDTTATGPEPVEPEPLPGRLPLPGDLREAGGILWWSDVQCKSAALELSSGKITRIPAQHCRVWPSPSGSKVIATAASRSDALEGKGLVEFRFPAPQGAQALEAPVVLPHPPGVIASEVVWPADEQAGVTCVATQQGTVVAGVARDARAVAPYAGEDACFPALLADGRLASAVGAASIVVDGAPILSDADLERLLPSVPRRAHRAVSALGGGEHELVAGLVIVSKRRLLPSSGVLAVITDAGEVRFSASLPEDVLPAAVGLSPDGKALWYFDASNATAHVRAIPGGREVLSYGARWVAWSPDGSYVALARDRSIAILTWPDGIEVQRIPVAASSVFWTLAPT
jgi:hypothetical protein